MLLSVLIVDHLHPVMKLKSAFSTRAASSWLLLLSMLSGVAPSSSSTGSPTHSLTHSLTFLWMALPLLLLAFPHPRWLACDVWRVLHVLLPPLPPPPPPPLPLSCSINSWSLCRCFRLEEGDLTASRALYWQKVVRKEEEEEEEKKTTELKWTKSVIMKQQTNKKAKQTIHQRCHRQRSC